MSNCDLVLVHFSTSINFAILNQKPLVFLTGAELMKEVSKDINSSLVYIDNEIVNTIDISVDANKYLSYKYKFMTSPESEKRTTIDIFVEFLNEVY